MCKNQIHTAKVFHIRVFFFKLVIKIQLWSGYIRQDFPMLIKSLSATHFDPRPIMCAKFRFIWRQYITPAWVCTNLIMAVKRWNCNQNTSDKIWFGCPDFPELITSSSATNFDPWPIVCARFKQRQYFTSAWVFSNLIMALSRLNGNKLLSQLCVYKPTLCC